MTQNNIEIYFIERIQFLTIDVTIYYLYTHCVQMKKSVFRRILISVCNVFGIGP